MRSFADVVLTGRGTAQIDNPKLTIRHVDGRQPIRVVLDSQGQLDSSLNLFSDPHVEKTLAVVGTQSSPSYMKSVEESGGRVWFVEADPSIDLSEIVDRLGKEGGERESQANEIFVEAGPTLASSFLNAGLVDRLYLFIAPKMMGSGISTFGSYTVEGIEDIYPFEESSIEEIDGDILYTCFKRSCPPNL
jgi:diaminohydroxyphosphoribosylaminopyrimidine deaminase/5-amino-6-(5-phosphoribosylamino)uracil reductase